MKEFFVVNPKSYLYGEELYSLAKKSSEIATKYNVKIFFTAPFIELRKIADMNLNIILTAQHLDKTEIGRGMGHIVAEMLKYNGVNAVIFNHAEHKLNREDIKHVIKRAKDNNLITIVCASEIEEVKFIANLSPDIILCEPTYLIGSGILSDDTYIKESTNCIRNINSNILVMQAAGVVKPLDVYKIISNGADGTGCTSGIILADNPNEMLEEMIKNLVKGVKDKNEIFS